MKREDIEKWRNSEVDEVRQKILETRHKEVIGILWIMCWMIGSILGLSIGILVAVL